MVAVLALHPLRHKNFHELTLGRQIRLLGGSWCIELETEETKTRKHDEKRLAGYLRPFLTEYLTKYRPILLQAGSSSREAGSHEFTGGLESITGPLWVSAEGCRLSYSGVGLAITESTEAALVRLSPHAFRRAVTTTAIHSYSPGLATVILQHTDARVTDEYYNRSSSLRAGEELSKILRSLK
jgi:integrase